MPPSQPFIHGCLRVKGRRGKHAIASNKQTIGWGKRMVCSGKSDDVFYPNRPCNFRTYQVPFFVQVVLLLLSWSILCVGMKEVYLSFNYNDIR